MNMLYLNNTGSRWIVTGKDSMKFELQLPNGRSKILKARCFESFGNFAVIVFRYCGKQYKRFPSDTERTVSGLPIVKFVV
jgi:hypothetical protein